jgi:hypothetical protein
MRNRGDMRDDDEEAEAQAAGFGAARRTGQTRA